MGPLSRIWLFLIHNQLVIAIGSLIWLLWRSGAQPRRLGYPCQQAAAANVSALALAFVPAAVIERFHRNHKHPHGSARAFARRAVMASRTLFAASVAFLLGWAGWQGYLYAKNTFSAKATAARPPQLASSAGHLASGPLSPRLLAPSEDEAIVAYHRDLSADYGAYPWGPEDGNTVYDLVWNTAAELHLGPSDNPLADLIQPGETVLLKPNLVHAKVVSVTRVAVLRPLVDMAVVAGASQIIIGDGTASDDYAVFDTAGITETWINYMDNLYGPDVSISRIEFDDPNHFYWVTLGTDPGGASTYVGSGYTDDDMVRAHEWNKDQYFGTPAEPRVDSRGFANTGSVMGWYAVSSYLLDADVVISVPKIKVHSHAVNTAAVKNWVGSTLKHTHPSDPENHWTRVDHHVYGATGYQMKWGCDVLWRDCGDLQRAQLYWDDGAMNPTPMRRYLVVIDGIHGGETDLQDPTPVHLGAIVASVDPVAADCVASRLMGFDWRPKEVPPGSGTWVGGVPMINNQPGASPAYPLGTNDVTEIRVIGDVIGPDPDYVFDFDDMFNESRTWPDYEATTMTDFTPPTLFTHATSLGGAEFLIRASTTGATVCFIYWGNESGMPKVARMADEGGGLYSYTIFGPVGEPYVIAQDSNLNTARRDVIVTMPGDFDGDADVDVDDYNFLAGCFSGPGGGAPLPCNKADFDNDDDVDLLDLATFSTHYSGGPQQPADSR